jgi:cell division protein ZapA
MKTVLATVYGKEYTLACDEGQEAHLATLIKQINARTERLDKAVGKLGEPLMLLYTALMVADELHDAQKEITRLKRELSTTQETVATADGDSRMSALEESLAVNLEELASRINGLADKLAA